MGIEKQVVSCRLDEKIIEKLKEIAEKENRTLSNLMETILKKYLTEQSNVNSPHV